MIDTRVSTKPLYSLPGWKSGEPAGPCNWKGFHLWSTPRVQITGADGPWWNMGAVTPALYPLPSIPTRQLQSVLGKTDELLSDCLKAGKGELREKSETF